MPRRWRNVVLLLVCAGLACALGCKKGTDDASGETKDTGITRTALRGPVELAVKTDRSRASIAERFRLTITVEAKDGIDVTMPQFGESLGAFSIRDFNETSARPVEGGKRRWRQEYEIDCDLSGKYKVDPITVTFVDRRKTAQGRPAPTTASASQPVNRLSAEPFELEVTSLLEGEFDPQKFRDVKGPVELPEPPSQWYWRALGIAATGIVVVLAVLLIRRRRRRGPKTIQIPPHEWAMDQLRQLIDEDLHGRDQVQAFYYRLNGIVRQYIELRFEVMAPEMTTEEFFDALRNSDALSAAHRERLEPFMTACDMVKYARHLPGKEEVERVFATARNFIEQTSARGRAEPAPAGDSMARESAA